MILDKRLLATSTFNNNLDGLEIKPTVSSDELHVVGKQNEDWPQFNYIIVNSVGMTSQQLSKLSKNRTIDISALSNGLYSLILYERDKLHIYKFIKI